MNIGTLFDKLKQLESQRQDVATLKTQLAQLEAEVEPDRSEWLIQNTKDKIKHAETIYHIMRSEEV